MYVLGQPYSVNPLVEGMVNWTRHQIWRATNRKTPLTRHTVLFENRKNEHDKTHFEPLNSEELVDFWMGVKDLCLKGSLTQETARNGKAREGTRRLPSEVPFGRRMEGL